MTASAEKSSSTTLLDISISAAKKRATAQRRGRERDPRGYRYDHRSSFDPRTSLSRPARKAAIETTTAAIPDPHDPGKRVLANVHRRVDLLEDERAHGRISTSQYEIGRQVQAVFEQASGARSSSGVWGVMAGAEVQRDTHGLASQEVAMIRRIAGAREVKFLLGRVERAVGPLGARMLRELLSGAGTFKAYAQSRDALASERAAAQVADRFRFLLEGLDEAFAARGLVQKDADGEAVIVGFTGQATGEETDERGRVVPSGHGYRWGNRDD